MACSLVENPDGCLPGYKRDNQGNCIKCDSTGISPNILGNDYLYMVAGAPQAIPADNTIPFVNTPATPSPQTSPVPTDEFWGKVDKQIVIIASVVVVAIVAVFVYVKFFKISK